MVCTLNERKMVNYSACIVHILYRRYTNALLLTRTHTTLRKSVSITAHTHTQMWCSAIQMHTNSNALHPPCSAYTVWGFFYQFYRVITAHTHTRCILIVCVALYKYTTTRLGLQRPYIAIMISTGAIQMHMPLSLLT